MSSLGYPELCCTVRLSELKPALILSSQAECSVLSVSDGTAKQRIIRCEADTSSTETGNLDKSLGWGSPCSCPGQKVPLGCRVGSAVMLTPAWPWGPRWSPGGPMISLCAGLITPSSPQSLQLGAESPSFRSRILTSPLVFIASTQAR